MLSKNLEMTMQKSIEIAKEYNHSQATIEHLLLALLDDDDSKKALKACAVDLKEIHLKLHNHLQSTQCSKSKNKSDITPNIVFQKIIHRAAIQANLSGISNQISGVNVLAEILLETDSTAAKILHNNNITRLDIINYMIHGQEYPDFILSQKNSIYKSSTIASKPSPDFSISISPQEEKAEPEILKNYCVNLNKAAFEGKVDILIGRENEIDRLIEILCRRMKNNPLLVGDPGVGKTAIVEGLAHKIAHKKAPKMLSKATIFSLDLGSLLAGTRYRGDFEERIKSVIKELSDTPGSILFIDEIHSIIGAGSTNGNALDASNLLKPALARGKIKCIGSTTHNEFYKYFSKDKSLIRRFQQVNVDEPSIKASIQILKGLRKYYETYHNVHYGNKVIEAAVTLSKRYVTDKQLPDKAIDIMDEAGAYLSVHNNSSKKINVTLKDVEQIVAKIAKIPAVSVTNNEAIHLKNIEKRLKDLIFGQDLAIQELCSAVKLSRAGLRNVTKPMGCFMFAGPTGVGKTELAIQLAKLLNMSFLRFDMSEYLEHHSISKLVGSPPGYVGYDSGGLMTEEVTKHPYSVVLLDEIEKAHHDIYNILLQIMDYGTLTDQQGKKVNFHNTIVIMTTNAGAEVLYKNPLGFDSSDYSEMNNKEAISKIFSPEFRNRLDAIISFKTLTKEVAMKVAHKFMEELKQQLTVKNTSLSISNKVYEYIYDKSNSEVNGARVMDRIINEEIKRFIANEILFGKLVKGGKVCVNIVQNEISFTINNQSTTTNKLIDTGKGDRTTSEETSIIA